MKLPRFNSLRGKILLFLCGMNGGLWLSMMLPHKETSPSITTTTVTSTNAPHSDDTLFDSKNDPYNLNNQIFEAAPLSIHRGVTVDRVENQLVLRAHDTVDVFLGFNPIGLRMGYEFDTQHALAESPEPAAIGYNRFVFDTDVERFDSALDQDSALAAFFKKHPAPGAFQDDALIFTTPCSNSYYHTRSSRPWNGRLALELPMGIDTSFAETLNPEKPVLIAFFSHSQRDGRKQSGQQNIAFAKHAYGDKNVVVIDEPTDEKVAVLADIFHRRFSNTRIDFCTDLDHREGRSTVEYRALEPYSGNYIQPAPYDEPDLYITDERVAAWMKQFPGDDRNKRITLFECSVGDIIHDTLNPLRNFGLVVAPSPSKTYNYSTPHGSLGKEVLSDMRAFDFNKPVAPQIKKTKEALRTTYDAPVIAHLQNGDTMPIGSVRKLKKVLQDPLNQIYINAESVAAPKTSVKNGGKSALDKPVL